MCVPGDAQLPHLPGSADPPTGARTVLTAPDGATFAAHQASAPDPAGAGVVVLPDVRGLFDFYARLAERFAAAGLDAIAIDYFGRTAGTDPRGVDWEFWPHVEATTPAQVRSDVAAAVQRLRMSSHVTRVYTVGFCFGGGHSFAQAAAGLGLAGVVGFYGPPRRKRPNFAAPIDVVDRFDCPVLGLFGGADQSIPAEQVHAFGAALTDAGVDHDLHTYPGAPHSFFDRSYTEYADICVDAWRRVLSFTGVG